MYGQCKVNPFRSDDPARCQEDLAGRSKEVRRILQFISRGQSVSLVGPLGSGKTWLLDRIARVGLLEHKGISVAQHIFLRLSGRAFARLDQPTCLSGFCAEILAQCKHLDGPLKDHLMAAGAEVEFAGHRGLRTLFRIARECGFKPVLILDDFDELAQNGSLNDNFFAALRSLATGYEVVYLVASQRPLYELEKARPEASTLCGICHQFLLRPCAQVEQRLGEGVQV